MLNLPIPRSEFSASAPSSPRRSTFEPFDSSIKLSDENFSSSSSLSLLDRGNFKNFRRRTAESPLNFVSRNFSSRPDTAGRGVLNFNKNIQNINYSTVKENSANRKIARFEPTLKPANSMSEPSSESEADSEFDSLTQLVEKINGRRANFRPPTPAAPINRTAAKIKFSLPTMKEIESNVDRNNFLDLSENEEKNRNFSNFSRSLPGSPRNKNRNF